MSLDISTSNSTAREIVAARQAGSVAFLHRAPFALDAYKLGFLPGLREDCGYQQTQFEHPGHPGRDARQRLSQSRPRAVRRTLFRVRTTGRRDRRRLRRRRSRRLRCCCPRDTGLFPRCRPRHRPEVPRGDRRDSRRPRARLLARLRRPAGSRIFGAERLARASRPYSRRQSTETAGRHRAADPTDAHKRATGRHRGTRLERTPSRRTFGDFWTADDWDDSGRDADHVTVRKTVRHSLARLKKFWQSHGIWPDSTPQGDSFEIEYEEPSPGDLDGVACTKCEANVWTTQRGPFVAEYDTGAVCGYCSYDCYFSHRHRNNLEEIAGKQSVYFPPT